jgi:hypothetical protein
MLVQEAPRLGNRLAGDPALLGALERMLSKEAWEQARDDLTRFAGRVGEEFAPMQMEAEANLPRHVPFDAWGRRVDRVDVSPVWLKLVQEGLENGLVAVAYEQPGPDGRVLQAALVQLFQPASAMATYPMAMTDGAARVLLAHDPQLAAVYVPRLTRRPAVRRLKDKMGTHALPTAELELGGTLAVPVGGTGRGLAKVATRLNFTRLWAAHGAVGPAGHLLALARDYASRREAFGRHLSDLPIHTS